MTDTTPSNTVQAIDPKVIVRDGYDRVSYAYRGDEFDFEKSGYAHWLRRLAMRIAPGVRVLDLGCGCGVPAAREMVKRYAVTGIDLSPVQIERARTLVPQAMFVCADMTAADFAPASFDAVVAFYSIINVPVAEQAKLIHDIAEWLSPGGIVLAILGKHQGDWVERDWRGVEGATMYWSHASLSSYRAWFTEAGLAIVEEGTQPERGTPGFAVLMARKAGGAER